MRDTTYDVESFPNFFSCTLLHAGESTAGTFEISSRRNDAGALAEFVPTLERMVGFNNVSYDYPLLHDVVGGMWDGRLRGATGEQIAGLIYEKSQEIIAGIDHPVWDSDRYAPQLDLLKVHHLDNRARFTSLKALQFAMRSRSIVESPVPFGTVLTPAQMDQVIDYNRHDVFETDKFRQKSAEQIAFRDALGPEWWNLSDTSIGKRYFRERLEKRNPGCTKGKTPRDFIRLADIIFPWIRFKYEPFDRKLRELKAQTVAGDLRSDFGRVFHDGFTFEFGSGGLHGSVKKEYVRAGAGRILVDIDVTSFYPRLAIVNRFYPEHLGPVFCDVYSELFDERALTAKGSGPNQMYKLALNGVYGDSNSEYGAFFDPAYTLTTTVNGQLQLCMLAESVLEIPGARLIQANTDGLTVELPADQDGRLRDVCAWWEWGTGQRLERVDYSRMWIRDVNNYVAESVAGKIKRNGAYEYKLDWWQDPSALAVPRAAEAAMVHGADLETFLREHAVKDPWDFMLRAKVPRSSRLYYGHYATPEEQLAGVQTWHQVQNLSRYYMSTGGQKLVKMMPPLKKAHAEEREISIQKGQGVTLVNTYDGRTPPDLNLDWYVREAKKLVIK